MKKNTILALDLGTQTGWAVYSSNGSIISGTQNFKPQRFEGGGMRFLRFKRWLDELYVLTNSIEEVYFEEVRRHIGVDAAHVYGGFLSQLSMWCEEAKIPYSGVSVGTIKKHLTGKGNASKEMMIEEVKKLGYHPKDDNEADAIALLMLVIER